MPKRHPYEYLVEPLSERPGYERRHMFGCLGCYYRGKLVAVLAEGEAPWNGFLVPAEREQHAAVMAEFPMLTNHPVLPKWLLLHAEDDRFETIAGRIVERILEEDPRFGVIPKPKKKRPKKSARKKNS
ncbi:MAG: hypothetical protein ACQKBW_11660 [Puniceicoccales bacterium]